MTATTPISRSAAADTHRGAVDRAAARDGVRDMLVLLVGIVPLGVVVGATTAEQTSAVAALASATTIFGASAQLATTGQLAAGAGLGAAVVTGLLVNARLVAYSASLARRWRGQPQRFKALAATTLVEPTFALAGNDAQTEREPAGVRHHYAAAAATLWLGWMAATAAGVAIGPALPELEVLDLLVPISFSVMLAPTLRTRAGRAATASAVVAAVLANVAGAGNPLLFAIGAGAVAGALAERGRP